MNWRKWLDAIAAADTVDSTLPEISEEEARLYCEAITRVAQPSITEPPRGLWTTRYGETWEEWLKRSAAQQPRREADDGG